MNPFTLGAVQVGATVLDQITAQTVTFGLEAFREPTDGNVDARAAGFHEGRPMVSFTTQNIASAMTSIGVTGLVVSSESPLELFYRATGGTAVRPESGHRKGTVNRALIVPRTLTLEQGALASLDAEAVIGWDGTNPPIAYAGTATLPVTSTSQTKHTLGPVSIGGAYIDGVQSVTIDFGMEVMQEITDGDAWPSVLWVQRRDPVIRVTWRTPVNLAEFGISGDGSATDSLIVYARKKGEYGTINVADATAEHVSFEAARWLAHPQTDNASEGDLTTSECEFIPYEGTEDVLQVSTSTSIPVETSP